MKTRLAAAFVIEIVLLLSVSLAQQSSLLTDPDAERILDKAAQAEGGDNVLTALRTLHLKGGIYWGSASSPHLQGDIESVIKFPDKFRDIFLGLNGSTLNYGFDGTEAWTRLTGGQWSTGLPRLQILLPAAQWRLRHAEARFLGQRKIGKRLVYVIRALVHGQATAADYYYDAADYLLLQVDTNSKTPPITYRVSNFQEISGLKVPREWSYGANRIVISSIKTNTDIDDSQFARVK